MKKFKQVSLAWKNQLSLMILQKNKQVVWRTNIHRKNYKIAEKKFYKLLLLTICYISNQVSASIFQILTQLKSMSLIREKSLLSGRDSFELPRHIN